MKMKKRIAVGTERFDEIIRDGYYYVDKTMYIKTLLFI